MVFKNFSAPQKVLSVFFLAVLAASLGLGFLQLGSGTGFAIGTWFPPLYFLLLFEITHNLHNLKKILKKAYKPLFYIITRECPHSS